MRSASRMGMPVDQPGDLVQVDTLDVRPVPGVVLKHFTARDIVSRWDVLEAHTRATATRTGLRSGGSSGRSSPSSTTNGRSPAATCPLLPSTSAISTAWRPQ